MPRAADNSSDSTGEDPAMRSEGRADVAVIVPAAGKGTRFGAARGGTARNKVLEPLAGRPILRRTLEALALCPDVAEIIVPASPGDREEAEAACRDLPRPCRLVPGGETRQQSVRNALDTVRHPIVAVHDAARPLITAEVFTRCIESVRAHGTGIAALPVSDTLKRQAGCVILETPPREEFWAAQTPQCCRAEDLRAAYETADADGFAATDEASLLEHAGFTVRLALGSARNLKVTAPEDLALAEALVREGEGHPGGERRETTEGKAVVVPRIGYGYDVHRFAEGRPMILGGVDFGLQYGLLGHSDADALLHAVMDALLGAAGMPDIGHLFPNTDERWRGASSLDLLAEVVSRVRAGGHAIGNVDTTVIAERPKIAPHVPAMRANIARACGIPVERVGLKATTHEGLGSLGAGEGLAAHAVCILFG